MGAEVLKKKKQTVATLKEKLAVASALLISEYRGFTVKEISELRKSLRPHDSEFKVVKNTLLQRALADSDAAEIKEMLHGQTAVLLAYKDPVGPLKAFVNFVKETEKGEIKAGIIEKTFVKKDQIVAISKLPGKDILLGKLAASFKSPLYGLVNVLNGPARKLVYALKAIAEKKGGEQK